MVHFVIENLLSTSADRGLYEALWLVSVTKKNSSLNYNEISVKDSCNKLIQQWNNREKTRENFHFATHLAFGVLYIYKFQVDKFFDETQTVSRSFRLQLCDMNWIGSQMSQRHSTPKAPTKPVAKNQTKEVAEPKNKNRKAVKSKKKLTAKEEKENLQQSQLNNDFEELEDFFKVLEFDDLSTTSDSLNPQKKGKNNKKGKATAAVDDDSGIDPTMAISTHAITIFEPNSSTIVTSGIQSCLNLALEADDVDDFGGFGTENAMDFQRLIMESDEVASSQANIITAAAKEIMNTPASYNQYFNNNKEFDGMPSPKKRRLTYEQFELDIDILRDTNTTQQNLPDLSSIENNQMMLSEIEDIVVSSSDQNANEPKETQASAAEEEAGLQEIVPSPQEEEEVESAPELILEEISKETALPKKRKLPNRKLIIDKVKEYDFATLQKNPEKYETRPLPMDGEFNARMLMQKTHVDLLFSAPCSTLRNASPTLRNLYDRNLKKIPAITSRKRKLTVDENEDGDKENQNESIKQVAKRRKTLRVRDTLKDYNEVNMMNKTLIAEEPMDLELPPPPSQPPVAIANFNDEQIPLPPMDDFVLPPAIEFNDENHQNTQASRRSRRQSDDEGSKLTKQEVLTKLKQLWKQKDQSITMEKLTEGLSRIAAAGVFFELMNLSKLGVVELIHKQNSLEIGHIECKMSASRITKLYF